MTRAMLLCAGLGTRLGALSSHRPKPLLPVCDVPIVRYGIANLVAQGITDIVINLHHQGQQFIDELGDGSALGARIQYSHEDTILGTGGGLKQALDLLDPEGADEPFVSLNGKLIFDIDVMALLETHARTADTLGTMVVRPVEDAVRWGAVDVRPDADGLRVHDILGLGQHMFCGVHVTRPSVVRRLPDGEACMIRQGYLPWLKSGERVSAHVHELGYFAEHSTPKRYLQSNIDLLGEVHLTNPPGELRGVSAEAQVHVSATIVEPVRIGAGARIGAGCRVGPFAVVGAGAVLAPQASVERSIVWPGSRVEGELLDCIVTPSQVVPAAGGDAIDA